MKHLILTAIIAAAAAFGASAQNSFPAPGGGGGFGNSLPAPGAPTSPGFGGNSFFPGNQPPYAPPYGASPVWSPAWQNAGTIRVVGCGYDAYGVWRTIPMVVNYQFNGVVYNVVVLSAWDPWTQTWNTGMSLPAVNTNYDLRGQDFHFYAVLSTGTFYFNL